MEWKGVFSAYGGTGADWLLLMWRYGRKGGKVGTNSG